MNSDKLVNLSRFIEKASAFNRVRLTIRSTVMPKVTGDPFNSTEGIDGVMTSVEIDGAEVRAFLTRLIHDQGIGHETPEGVLVWLPWPFASITVQRIQ